MSDIFQDKTRKTIELRSHDGPPRVIPPPPGLQKALRTHFPVSCPTHRGLPHLNIRRSTLISATISSIGAFNCIKRWTEAPAAHSECMVS
jgi:hypothetical protein